MHYYFKKKSDINTQVSGVAMGLSGKKSVCDHPIAVIKYAYLRDKPIVIIYTSRNIMLGYSKCKPNPTNPTLGS